MLEVTETTDTLIFRLEPEVVGEPTSMTSVDGKWHVRAEDMSSTTYTISFSDFGVKLELYKGVPITRAINLLQAAAGVESVKVLQELERAS